MQMMHVCGHANREAITPSRVTALWVAGAASHTFCVVVVKCDGEIIWLINI